jgi:hypothetical protein
MMVCPDCGAENPPGANFCAKCGSALSAAALSPGVGSSFGHGWRTLRKNFADLFLAAVIFLALNLPVAVVLSLIAFSTANGGLFFEFESFPAAVEALSWEYRLAGSVFSIFYSMPLLIGLSFVFLTAVRGEKVKLADIFAAFKNYRNILPLTAVYVIVTGTISFLLTLLTESVPSLGVFLSFVWSVFGIVLFCKLVFVPFLLLDRPLKPLDALGTSWLMSRGHEWRVFAIGLLAALMFAAVALVALLVTLVYVLLPATLYVGLVIGVLGYIFLSMWLLSAFASLYHAVSSLSASPPFPPAR